VGSNQPGATSGDNDYFSVTRLTPDGSADPTFGPGGAWSDYIGGTDSKLQALAAASDGTLFGTGWAGSGTQYVGGLVRTGTQSAFFAVFNNCYSNGAAMQSSDRAVSVGACGDYPVAIRQDISAGPAIQPDTTFNGTGASQVSTTTGEFTAAAIDASNRLVAVGTRTYPSGPDDYLLVRYLANGLMDPSFHDSANLAGRVSAQIGEYDDQARAVAIQPDGKILVAGWSDSLSSSAARASLARFNSDGSLDSTFGSGGRLVLHLGDDDSPLVGIALQPNGKIVVVGGMAVNSKTVSVVARLLSNGSFDGTFAPGGLIQGIPNYAESTATGVGLLANGKILVGELLKVGGQQLPGVVRLLGGEVSKPLIAPSATISIPKKSKLSVAKFMKISGSATGDGLTSVEIAVVRSDAKLLKQKRRCLQLASNKAKFKKVKAVNKKCVPSKWLRTKGTTNWSYKLKRKLPTGRYSIYARAKGAAGVQATPTKKSLKLTK
jgi:uncharacterized delta-60 repeat protein